MTDRELLQSFADVIPGSYVEHTGGNVWAIVIELEGNPFKNVDGPYAMVTTDLTEAGSWVLGVYTDAEDEGTIVKEWQRGNVDEDAGVVFAALDTWALPSFDAVEAVGLDGTGRDGGPYGWFDVLSAR